MNGGDTNEPFFDERALNEDELEVRKRVIMTPVMAMTG
jgi:hypothetical protein